MEEILEYKNKLTNKILFEYKLKYKNQKNIVLSIRNSALIITCPYGLPKKKINSFIDENIVKISELVIKYNNNKLINLTRDNFFVYILGKKHKIFVVDKNIHTKKIDDDIFLKKQNCLEKQIKSLYSFLKKEYNYLIFELIKKWLKITNEKINEVIIKNLLSKWGLCYNKKRKIVLNIKLIHFDIDIIEYVILHEIAHLKYSNHSKNFWSYIENYFPNYKIKNKMLKKYYV